MTKHVKTHIALLRNEREASLDSILMAKRRQKLEIHGKYEQLKDDLRREEWTTREHIKQKAKQQLEHLISNRVRGRTRLCKDILCEKKAQLQLSKERLKHGLEDLRRRARDEKIQVERVQYFRIVELRNNIKNKIKLLRGESLIVSPNR